MTDAGDDPTEFLVGTAIRFMWDYGVIVPLWNEDGLCLTSQSGFAAHSV